MYFKLYPSCIQVSCEKIRALSILVLAGRGGQKRSSIILPTILHNILPTYYTKKTENRDFRPWIIQRPKMLAT